MIGINVLRALQDYRILEFFAGYGSAHTGY